jgi:hypothetical protein
MQIGYGLLAREFYGAKARRFRSTRMRNTVCVLFLFVSLRVGSWFQLVRTN